MIGFVAAGAFHVSAILTYFFTEYSLFAFSLALLSWGLINFVWLLLFRRPGISAALSLMLIGALIALSQFKFGIIWMTLTFLDLLMIDRDMFAYLVQIFPQLRIWIVAGVLVLIPLLILIWWIDPFRIPRKISAAGAALCCALIAPLALAVPEEGFEPFQGINHISSLSRSGVHAVSQLLAHGWIEAASEVTDPTPVTGGEACKPARKLPNIIAVLDESSFDAAAGPGIKLPEGYSDHFKSFDGKMRSLLVEATGGPTWFTEYNLLTGLSVRSFGKMKYYVTRIAAERVTRGLPYALARCGYNTFTLYPALGDFLSARRFQTGVGVKNFIDQHGMGADVEVHPDTFFYDKTIGLIAREDNTAPLFILTYLTANHFPWTIDYRSDLTPDWKPPGNTPEVDEFLRRQMMSARDYAAFVQRLKQEFPNEAFLIVRFGDHQPSISNKILEPDAAARDVARRVMNHDPKYFTTHYVIDAVNFTPADLSLAEKPIDAAYLPLIIQEAAGVPLDPSFIEQKKIFLRCAGKFFDCAGGAEARRFNKLLMDAGLIKDL